MVLRTHKARYPPFQRILNLAKVWLPNGDPTDSRQAFEEFIQQFCVRKNVKEEERPTLKLAVLTLINDKRPPPPPEEFVTCFEKNYLYVFGSLYKLNNSF